MVGPCLLFMSFVCNFDMCFLFATMTSEQLNRHEMYYFNDGSIVIQVIYNTSIHIQFMDEFQQAGNKLYQLYQELLIQKSGFFEMMLSLPQPGQKFSNGPNSINYKFFKEKALALNLDGSSDEKALVLPHSAEEFDHLLSFIHPPK
jgi:hypothetical protein